MQATKITRRDSLKYVAASACGGDILSVAAPDNVPNMQRTKSKTVAAVITEYWRGSHADVLIGKILEGWKQDGGPGPALQLASMYIDQFPPQDLARTLAARYKVPLFATIANALTLGGDHLAVDGVISIGEHGNYPWNERQQHLYPRRRFFEQITDTLARFQRVVPVFNDKHLGPVWSDAKWMYDQSPCNSRNGPSHASRTSPICSRRSNA